MERCSAIPKWMGPRDGLMVVNMEWGGFGSARAGRSILPVRGPCTHIHARKHSCCHCCLPFAPAPQAYCMSVLCACLCLCIVQLTSVDNKLDALSPNPSKQRFEKTMSGGCCSFTPAPNVLALSGQPVTHGCGGVATNCHVIHCSQVAPKRGSSPVSCHVSPLMLAVITCCDHLCVWSLVSVTACVCGRLCVVCRHVPG